MIAVPIPIPLHDPESRSASAHTEHERMLAGDLYHASDAELTARRTRARRLLHLYNASDQTDQDARMILLTLLLGRAPERAWIEPPFFCDYGENIHLGPNVYINANCTVLDCAPVCIGRNALIGPHVQIYSASHPIDPTLRRTGAESSESVTIGADVWIGGGSVICPGVTIGEGSVIGAGSVVTSDIPAGVVAAGNPCRVLRPIEDSPPQRAHHAVGRS